MITELELGIAELNLSIHHKILIILYLVVYLAAMLIQIQDTRTKVKFIDWILAFLTSAVGGIVTYFAIMSWANIGIRMATTLFASLVSYRTIKFIVSNEAQEDFAAGFWAGIKIMLQRLFNTQNSNNDNGPHGHNPYNHNKPNNNDSNGRS